MEDPAWSTVPEIMKDSQGSTAAVSVVAGSRAVTAVVRNWDLSPNALVELVSRGNETWI